MIEFERAIFGGVIVEWLLAVAAFVIWLLFKSSGNRRKAKSHSRSEPKVVAQEWSHSPVESRSRKQSNALPAKWVLPGEAVEIGGIKVTSGMIYVGGALPTKHGSVENCLIDPSLRLSPRESDKPGSSMPYWPSYTDIQPKARRAYIEWLAGGRNDPAIGMGYVFLFFYGLERRYLVDGAKAEAPEISAEVQRLLGIYGDNNSFRGYAKRFLDVVAILENPENDRPELSSDLRNGYEMPMSVRLYLGRRLAERVPFDAHDALLWVLSVPDTYLRTAATRCFDEFVSLWRIKFAERHAGGLKVRAPRTPLKLEYRAASGSFDANVAVLHGNGSIPDIAAITAPLDGLRDLVNACTEALDPYSRLLGRKPDARGSVEAALLLPKELAESQGTSPLRSVVDKLEPLFAGRPIAPVMTSKLLDILDMPLAPGIKLSTSSCNHVGALLDRLDIAFEPDRRYGSGNLTQDGRAILFKAAGGAAVDAERPTYGSARTLIEITALAAASDGDVAASEYEAVKAELRALPDLSTTERMRLLAYAGLVLKDAPRQQTVMNKLAKLPEKTRKQVAQSAIAAVLADGHASPGEVRFLEKLYKALGYSKDDVYAALHRGSVIIDEPVVVSLEVPATGTPIPKKPTVADESVVRIDEARLQRLRQETSAVSALLAGIFVEEEAPSPSSAHSAAAAPPKASFKGLDGAHGDLLLAVIEAGSIDRAAFEERARTLRLLPEGAIETINEWGFETFDEPILEGEDPISIPDHLRTELQRLEKAA